MTRSREEEREMELERNARVADLEVVLAKLERDTQVLQQRLSAAGSEAERHAKDLQYLRQRQKTLVKLESFYFHHLFSISVTQQFTVTCQLEIRLASYPRSRVELRTGEEFVNDWFKKNCCLVQVDETYQGAIAGFLQFREQFRGRVGQESFGSHFQSLFACNCHCPILKFQAILNLLILRVFQISLPVALDFM